MTLSVFLHHSNKLLMWLIGNKIHNAIIEIYQLMSVLGILSLSKVTSWMITDG
jgi:hypothetical protein